MRLTVLQSSSAGNSCLISADRTHLLVDAGMPARKTFEALAGTGVAPEDLTGILITHEHSDHVAGLNAIARKLDIPIYLTAGTADALRWKPGYTPKLEIIRHEDLGGFEVGKIWVDATSIQHDAADPVAFTLVSEGVMMTIATDLGATDAAIEAAMDESDVVLLEANHDLQMLKVGPYPWKLKERIMGPRGHLSNDMACEYLKKSARSSRTSTLILGHLSVGNNHPEIARLLAEEALGDRSVKLWIAGTDTFGTVVCG